MTSQMIDLDLILKSPERIAEVPVAEVPAVLNRLASLQSMLAARLTNEALSVPTPSPEPPAAEDHLIDAKEAAKILGVKHSWLYRNAKRLPFTRKLSRKQLRFSKSGLHRWKANLTP